MCVLCGYGLTPYEWADAGPDGARSGQREARRARIGRTALCRAVLAPYGVDVRADTSTGFAVSDRKGRTRFAGTLAELWREAEALGSRPPDPLDPRLLEALGDG